MANELATLLTRIAACNAEISGVTAYRLNPPMIAVGDIPLLYAFPLGYTETLISTNQVQREYRIDLELLAQRVPNTPSSSALSQGTETTAGLIDTITNYWQDHRFLHTSSLDNLTGVILPLTFRNTGVEFGFSAPDGNLYFASHWEMAITVRVAMTRNF